MKTVTLMMVSVLCVAIWWKAGHRRGGEAATESADGASAAAGWIQTAPPSGTNPNQVVIVAALNCPRAAAQRAVALARQLTAQQIPCLQTASVAFTFDNDTEAERLNKVMMADAPVVFVNHKAKANPALDEVVAEYRALVRR